MIAVGVGAQGVELLDVTFSAFQQAAVPAVVALQCEDRGPCVVRRGGQVRHERHVVVHGLVHDWDLPVAIGLVVGSGGLEGLSEDREKQHAYGTTAMTSTGVIS